MSWIAETLAALAVALGLASASAGHRVQGYVEGEYLRVAAPAAATLETLAVARGHVVTAGAPLFALDRTAALAERARLAAAVAQARSQLADLLLGRRPEELAVVEAQKNQAEASLRYTESEMKRQEELVRARVSSPEKLESARSAYERDRARLAELTAQLAVSRLPARPDQIQAAQGAVAMAEAALAQQERRLAEMAPAAPADALVDDTLYNPGEWVPAGSPVVSLLPPGRVKVIAFVPEPLMARVKPGDRVGLRCDGCPAGLAARVTFVASRAEYTPPVIYSIGSREKLVFRIEAKPEEGVGLNPGLPVDVEVGR
ncbi:HlyD family secretion protein [Azospirillum sp.]|uniref:HlyD family secretion protein n=1 Tax=Azospirillum sp. TaxID=34012 RepID=UPI003D71179B